MVYSIISSAILGIEGITVLVEVDVSKGLPSFDIVGLPDSSIKESKDRVRLAIKNADIVFPSKKITVNLAPADIKKEGSSYDLPIAVGILTCMGILREECIKNTFFSGELSLDGSLRPIKGILPMVHNAFISGVKNIVIPYENAAEAALVEGVSVIAVKHIRELISHFNAEYNFTFLPETKSNTPSSLYYNPPDFADVRGQHAVKRALEVSVSGFHNVLMVGPPGSGKTMMAKRLPFIMPEMDFKERMEVTKIYSVAGLTDHNHYLVRKRPFRAPHHTLSYAALTGGGRTLKPGEISLSHKGILFLDEFPEFNRNVLEVLRQPLEDKTVTIARASGTVTYPCDFLLVAAMNPCPCGHYFDRDKCTCGPKQVQRYLHKISGPLLDRIDIRIETPAVEYKEMKIGNHEKFEPSVRIKKRVEQTRQRQQIRYQDEEISYNAQLTAPLIDKYCQLDDESHHLLESAIENLGLSARGYHKILRVARTIADMEDAKNICFSHVAEAISYRTLDMGSL